MKFLAAFLSLAIFAAPAVAETYRVPAEPGALQAMIGKAAAGDVILLQDGNHGGLDLSAPAFAAPVVIRAEHFGKAHVESIYIRAGSNLTIGGLSVWPSDPYSHRSSHVETSGATSRIVFNKLDVRGGADAANFAAWSQDEWKRRTANGVWLAGANSVVQNSRFTGVSFGITILGADSRASFNVINGFSADGIRGQGQRGVYRGNTVQNCVAIGDGNHADGFQAHTNPSAPITGIVLDRNRFIVWNLPPHPSVCEMQGIGLFDGWYDNLTITNNIVAVSNGHGITVMGARKASIRHNTVTTANGLPAKWPWIDAFGLKDGTPSEGVIVANNLAMDIGQPKPGIVFVDNAKIGDPRLTLDPVTSAPLAASGFLDTANPAYRLRLDINGKTRGAAPDKGAVEAR